MTDFAESEHLEAQEFRAALTKFQQDIPHILASLRHLISQQEASNTQFRERRHAFLEFCREHINPDINIFDINEMLIQHILTEDIFPHSCQESQFHPENHLAREISQIINTFFTRETHRQTLKSIEHDYAVIRRQAQNIANHHENHHEKQKFIKVVYENFYQAYNPKAAERWGIVYTPNEIVRFMLETADYLLHQHFGQLLADPGLEILDPCTGTGTYITELIEYLPPDKLEYKYQHEIHGYERGILPYYIAQLNIEYSYFQKTGIYEHFPHLYQVDTLEPPRYPNSANLPNLNQAIRVIIGNPPYQAWQANFHPSNPNRNYREIDESIKATYIKEGAAQNQIAIYDMYVRFYRWAADCLGENGLIAFITNRSFIDGKAFDGFRKVVDKEFDFIYLIDVGGDIRSGDTSGNVFNIKTGVAVMFLVRHK